MTAHRSPLAPYRSTFFFLFLLLIHPLWVHSEADVNGLKARRLSIDPFRSYLSFSLGFMKVKQAEGTFHEYTGTIMFSEDDITRSSVTASVAASSIFTGVEARDRHLRSPDFFDTERFPQIWFQSTGIQRSNSGLVLNGKLTMHGQTRPLKIQFEHSMVESRSRGERFVFNGATRLKRRDFGVIGNFWGNKVLANEVNIELHIEAVPVEESRFALQPGPPSTHFQELLESARLEGAQGLRRRHRELVARANSELKDATLLEVALALMESRAFEAAVAAIRLNLEYFPSHTPSWDVLGYLQAKAGSRAAAISTYRTLLQLNSRSTAAAEMLRWLGGNSTNPD